MTIHLFGYTLTLKRGQKSAAQNYVDAVRADHPKAYTPWSCFDDEFLVRHQRKPIQWLASAMQRQPSAIESRLRKLNLVANALHPQIL
jgi:alkylhydroperoxidase/carboxymuconolactone decarboxylase family protein YurZ